MRGNPEKKKQSEIAKKNLGRGDFGGSVGAQQTDKILRMALQDSKAIHIKHVSRVWLLSFVIYETVYFPNYKTHHEAKWIHHILLTTVVEYTKRNPHQKFYPIEWTNVYTFVGLKYKTGSRATSHFIRCSSKT